LGREPLVVVVSVPVEAQLRHLSSKTDAEKDKIGQLFLLLGALGANSGTDQKLD
jgi:hypothetical protein